MKCCVSTDVGTWTNWLTLEPDPDYSPDAGTGLLSPISYALQHRILLRRENPTYLYLAPVAAASRGFKLVLFTASRGDTFVWGTFALPSALLVSNSIVVAFIDTCVFTPWHCYIYRMHRSVYWLWFPQHLRITFLLHMALCKFFILYCIDCSILQHAVQQLLLTLAERCHLVIAYIDGCTRTEVQYSHYLLALTCYLTVLLVN